MEKEAIRTQRGISAVRRRDEQSLLVWLTSSLVLCPTALLSDTLSTIDTHALSVLATQDCHPVMTDQEFTSTAVIKAMLCLSVSVLPPHVYMCVKGQGQCQVLGM